MRKEIDILFILVLCVLLTGCAIHYHNEKSFEGDGKDVSTPYGKVSAVKVSFNSTIDVWVPNGPKGIDEKDD